MIAGQLQGQGWADALVALQQRLAERQGQELQAAAPVRRRFARVGRIGLQGRWWAVGVATGNRPQPGFVRLPLPAQGHHTPLALQQKEVAVAAHQLYHQRAADRFTGTGGKAQLHHPLPAVLIDRHQRQAAQPVLQLLGQGAALTAPGGRVDRQQAWRIRPPAQLQPVATIEGAKAELEAVGAGLLGLLEAARQQLRPQLGEHRPQGGDVHGLERPGGQGSGADRQAPYSAVSRAIARWRR